MLLQAALPTWFAVVNATVNDEDDVIVKLRNFRNSLSTAVAFGPQKINEYERISERF